MKTFFQLRAVFAIATSGLAVVVLLRTRQALEDSSKTNLNIVTFS